MNATGSFKNIAVIGKAAQPVCFRGAPPFPIKYYHQEKAWMNKAVYARWFAGLCTDWRAFTVRKGFLVMDNASGQDTSMTSDLMDTDWLPPNTTARFQPSDQDVKSVTKTTYKRGMTRDMLSTFDGQFAETEEQRVAREGRRARARAGSLDVMDGRSPHVLDAIRLVKVAWDTVTPSAIMRCWLRAKFTPPDVTRSIRARLDAAGAPQDIEPADDARAIVEMLQAARTLGPGGRPGEGGSGGGGEQGALVSGSHLSALPVIEQWHAAESREEAVMAMANES